MSIASLIIYIPVTGPTRLSFIHTTIFYAGDRVKKDVISFGYFLNLTQVETGMLSKEDT